MHHVWHTSFLSPHVIDVHASKVKMAYVKEILGVSEVKKALQPKELQDEVAKSEDIMNKWRTLLMEKGVDKHEPSLAFALSMADIALAAHTLGIRLSGEKQYRTAEGLAHDFVICMNGMGHEVVSPWQDLHEPSASSSQGPEKAFDPEKVLREVSEDGRIKNPVAVLESAGFEIGSNLKRKVDGVEGRLEHVDPSGVVKIKLTDDNRMAKLNVKAILSGEWSKFTPTADPVFFEGLQKHSALKHDSWKKQLAGAKVFMALDALAKKHETQVHKMVQLQLRPNKLVMALTKIQRHKLVLVPATTNLKPKTHVDELALFDLCMGTYLHA